MNRIPLTLRSTIQRCFVLLLLTPGSTLSAQLQPLYSVAGHFDHIAFDNLLNLYTIQGPEVKKYDAQGSLRFRYSDLQMGPISHLDVSYPLRPLLLYADLNTICILDNTLTNSRGCVNLLPGDIGLATLACTSVDNRYWVYDAMNFSLSRCDERLKPLLSTGNLAQILGAELQPSHLIERDNRVYLADPVQGIYVFDLFGTFIKKIPITGLQHFQVHDQSLLYQQGDKLLRYHPPTFHTDTLPLPPGAARAILQKDRLAVLSPAGATVYQILPP